MVEFIEKIYKTVDDYWITIFIETDEQIISFGIDNHNKCCENFGVKIIENEFDIKEYIGHELLVISWNLIESVSSQSKNGKDCYNEFEDKYYYTAVFNVQTSKGMFKVKIFNYHNNYYPHQYRIVGYGLNDQDEL